MGRSKITLKGTNQFPIKQLDQVVGDLRSGAGDAEDLELDAVVAAEVRIVGAENRDRARKLGSDKVS